MKARRRGALPPRDVIIPDLEWYAGRSRELGLTPRCPFATADACPIYFRSLSLLKDTGATTLDPKADARLTRLWHGSDLNPKLAEQDPTVTLRGEEREFRALSHFCPEVVGDRFGWFASSIWRYADEIDSEAAQNILSARGASRNDWGWDWSSVTALHYSDCRLYSPLRFRADHPFKSALTKTATTLRDHPLPVSLGILASTLAILNYLGVLEWLAGWIL